MQRPVELKLDPPYVQYQSCQDLIKQLDTARDAHENELLATMQRSKASLVQLADGDVAVKVEPSAPLDSSVFERIREVEAAREATLDRLVKKVLESRKRVHLVEGANSTDVVVKASSIPWKRVATLVDELETRTDASQQRILEAVSTKA